MTTVCGLNSACHALKAEHCQSKLPCGFSMLTGTPTLQKAVTRRKAFAVTKLANASTALSFGEAPGSPSGKDEDLSTLHQHA